MTEKNLYSPATAHIVEKLHLSHIFRSCFCNLMRLESFPNSNWCYEYFDMTEQHFFSPLEPQARGLLQVFPQEGMGSEQLRRSE